VTAESHAIVHPDYWCWVSDLTRWEQDVAVWQQELSAATAELDRAAGAVDEHRKDIEGPFAVGGEVLLTHHAVVLDDHRKALEGHRHRLREEPAFLAEFAAATGRIEAGEESPEVAVHGGALADRIAQHPRLREAHGRLGRHHRAVMETTARLLQAVAGST
jgi:hypothetical protein